MEKKNPDEFFNGLKQTFTNIVYYSDKPPDGVPVVANDALDRCAFCAVEQ